MFCKSKREFVLRESLISSNVEHANCVFLDELYQYFEHLIDQNRSEEYVGEHFHVTFLL